MASFEDYLFVKNTKWIMWGIIALILALLIFHAGYALGSRRGMPSRSDRDFRPYGLGLPPGFMPSQSFVAGGHGAAGTITAISLPNLTLKEDDGDDETIVITASTSIRIASGGMPPQDASSSAIMINQHAVILGIPEGTSTLQANLIDIHS